MYSYLFTRRQKYNFSYNPNINVGVSSCLTWMSGAHDSTFAPNKTSSCWKWAFLCNCIYWTDFVNILKAYSWLPVGVNLAWNSLQGFKSYFIIIRFCRQNYLPLKLSLGKKNSLIFSLRYHLILSRPNTVGQAWGHWSSHSAIPELTEISCTGGPAEAYGVTHIYHWMNSLISEDLVSFGSHGKDWKHLSKKT